VTEPDEGPGWRIRVGTGLVMHTPMSDERRAIIDREAEKERKAAEFEEEQRRQAALERRWELERQGVVPHTVADVLARLSYGADRTDKIEERRAREAADQMPPPLEGRLNRWELQAEHREAAAKAEREPASQSDLAKVAGKITSVANSINVLKRRL
jgi:hypothetical protein